MDRFEFIRLPTQLLTKEVDYKEYFFLFNQTDLELINETENFSDKEDVGYRTINPVRFEIGETNRKYVVFTEPR